MATFCLVVARQRFLKLTLHVPWRFWGFFLLRSIFWPFPSSYISIAKSSSIAADSEHTGLCGAAFRFGVQFTSKWGSICLLQLSPLPSSCFEELDTSPLTASAQKPSQDHSQSHICFWVKCWEVFGYKTESSREVTDPSNCLAIHW